MEAITNFFGSSIMLNILDTIVFLLTVIGIALLVLKANNKEATLKQLILFILINSLLVFARIALVSFFNSSSHINFCFAIYFIYFRNPIWMAVCDFSAIRIFNVSKGTVYNMTVIIFCACQLVVISQAFLYAFYSTVFSTLDRDFIGCLVLLTSVIVQVILFFGICKFINMNENRINYFLKGSDECSPKKVRTNYIFITIIWLLLGSTQFYISPTSIVGLLYQPLAFLLISIIIFLIVHLKLEESKVKNTLAYNEMLITSIEEFRVLKHDFDNLLFTYDSFIETRNYDKLHGYHRKFFKLNEKNNQSLFIAESLKKNPAVYGALLQAEEKAKEVDVKLSIDMIDGFGQINMDDFDLGRILSILINNAIEHATATRSKRVNISIDINSKNNGTIIISNDALKKEDVNKIFERGFSTKRGHTGIGLSEVKKILSLYPLFSIKASSTKNKFTMSLKIQFKDISTLEL